MQNVFTLKAELHNEYIMVILHISVLLAICMVIMPF